MERKTRFELATLALARRCSTAELLPHRNENYSTSGNFVCQYPPFLLGQQPLHQHCESYQNPHQHSGSTIIFYELPDARENRNRLLGCEISTNTEQPDLRIDIKNHQARMTSIL